MDEKYWYERIIDTIAIMEYNDFEPTDIYMVEEVYNDLLKYVPQHIIKRIFLPDKLMMMNIHIIVDYSRMRIVDGKHMRNYEKATEMI